MWFTGAWPGTQLLQSIAEGNSEHVLFQPVDLLVVDLLRHLHPCEARNAKSNLNLPFIRDIDAGIVSCPHGGDPAVWTCIEDDFWCMEAKVKFFLSASEESMKP